MNNSIRDYRQSFHLIIVDDCERLQNILNEFSVKDFHLAQRFLLVATEDVHNATESLNTISAVLWNNGLLNSNILIQDKHWSLNTFLPFQHDCSTMSRLQITTFTPHNFTRNMSSSINELFPQKWRNFNKCPVYIAAAHTKPFVIVHNNSGEDIRIEGIDILLVEHIAKVMDREVNLTIGGLILTKDRLAFLKPSHPIMQTSFGFAFRREDFFMIMSTFAAPFRTHMWIIICIFASVMTVLILLSKSLPRKWRHFYIGGRMNRSPILNMWLLILGKSIANPRIANGLNFSNFSRTLAIFRILLWFVIRSCYEAALFNKLQSNYPVSGFDTVEKVQSSDCKIVSVASAVPLMQSLIASERIVVINTEQTAALNYYYDHNDEINGVVLVADLACKYFNLLNSPRKRLTFTKDSLFIYTPVVYFHKQSIMHNIFNEEILEIREAGLINFWTKKYVDNRRPNSNQGTRTKLQIDHVVAVLHICSTMYAISFVVFIMEVISVKCRRIKYVLDYLTF
ncbi:uncharacterized protein LOC129564986 [Sitodiplosis mosellana]|uniref:uncharacterized protein LOC129564986 n=1 Tax=Sitodiplosis mosellana TaxID=263140 RepID=UPI0024439330|nr:uncharacterized protein LOC129564986 [Sitodiplosis mosellana]